MKIEQRFLSATDGWTTRTGDLGATRAQFALVFGCRAHLENPSTLEYLRTAFPGARLILGSTSGEITDTTVSEDSVTVTAVALEKTSIACAVVTVRSQFDSRSGSVRKVQQKDGSW